MLAFSLLVPLASCSHKKAPDTAAKLCGAATTTPGQVYAQNFEDPCFDWFTRNGQPATISDVGGSSAPKDPAVGAKYAVLTAGVTKIEGPYYSSWLTPIEVMPGSTYCLDFWERWGVGDDGLSFGIHRYGPNQVDLGKENTLVSTNDRYEDPEFGKVAAIGTDNGSWEHQQRTFQVPAGTNYLQIWGHLDGSRRRDPLQDTDAGHLDGVKLLLGACGVATPPPSIPTGLMAMAGNTEVSLSWNPVTTATHYNVKRSTTKGGPYTVVPNGMVTARSFVDRGLANNTKFFYVVSALNAGGESPNSVEVFATPTAAPPGDPSGLSVTVGLNQATLNWAIDNSAGATQFKIERKLAASPDSAYSQISTVGANVATFLDKPVPAGTYTWRVRAFGANGNSGYTNTVTATVKAPLPAPVLTATAASGQVSLSWTTVSAATGYTVKRATTSGGPYTTVAGGNMIPGTSLTDTSVTNGTPFFYVVSASNADGGGLASNEEVATPGGAAPTWVDDNIPSNITTPGSFTQSGGTFTVMGSGTDIFNTADQFNFVHRSLTGDGSITARVVSMCGGVTCQNDWAKAVVMMRNTTDPSSFNVAAVVSTLGSHKYRLQVRKDSTLTTTSTASTLDSQIPQFLRVTRAGSSFSAFFSSNGTTFTQIGTTQTVTMNQTIEVGLGVTSHTAGMLVTAVFDNVTITGGASMPARPPAPTGVGCTPGSNQCTLSWNAVTGATGYTVKRATVLGGPYTNVATNVTTTMSVDTTAANGSPFYYVVSATGAGGASGNSAEAPCIPAVPVPAAPTGLMATPADTQCSLTWLAVTNATNYTVKRGPSGGQLTAIPEVITATSYVDTTVMNGTPQSYVVSAVNGTGEGPNSTSVTCTPAGAAAPMAPIALFVTGGQGQATLTWQDRSTDEMQFRIERKALGAPDTAFTEVAAVGANTTTFTDGPGLPGGAYTWRVRASNMGANSGFSNKADAVVTDPPTLPAAPTNPSATGGAGQAVLRWQDNSNNETGFKIERKPRGLDDAFYQLAGNVGANVTTFTNTPLPGGSYTWRVRASNGTLDSPPSSGADATVTEAVLFPPTGLVAAPGDAQVALMWNPVAGAVSYSVKRSLMEGTGYQPVPGGTVTSTSFVDPGLSNGTPYHYVVTAINGGVESSTSAEATATPVAAPMWVNDNIGAAPTPPGSLTINGGTFTVKGAGTFIGDTADAFDFAHQSMTGDGTITARLASLCGGGACPSTSTQVGLMMRDGILPGALHVSALVSPMAPGRKYSHTHRPIENGTSFSSPSTMDSQIPTLLRITRAGDVFTTFFSTDGGGTFTPITSTTLVMNSTIQVGFAVCSTVGGPVGTLATAAFDMVSVTQPVRPAAPTGLKATPGNNQITLTWNAVAGATDYIVKRGPNGGPYTPIGSPTTTTSFIDTMPQGSSWYVVSARKGTLEGPDSSQVGMAPLVVVASWNFNMDTNSANVLPAFSTSFETSSNGLLKSPALAPVVTPVATGAYFADGWPAGALDTTRYLELSSTATVPGRAILYSSLSFFLGNGQTGSSSWQVRSSADNFASVLDQGSFTNMTKVSFSANISALGTRAGTVTFRVYTFNNTGTTATRRGFMKGDPNGRDLVITGAIVDAPPPPPAKVTGLTCTPGNGQCTLTWNPVAGATSYAVKRSLLMNGTFMDVNPSVIGTTFVDNMVMNGTPVFYQVAANNVAGQGPPSDPTSACTPGGTPQPPPPPTGVTPQPGDGKCTISWDAVSTAASYNIKRGASAMGTFSNVGATAAGTSFVDGTAMNGGTFFYVVSSINAAGEGMSSSPAVQCQPIPVPAAPTNLQVPPNSGMATMTWTDNSNNETLFRIERKLQTEPVTSFAVVGMTGPNQAEFSESLPAGGSFSWRVVAHNASGDSAPSNIVDRTILPSLSPPTNFTATPGDGQVTLTWNAVNGATLYLIERSTTSGAGFQPIPGGTLPGTTFTDTGLTNGVPYFYVVSAFHTLAGSGRSGQVPATPNASNQWIGSNIPSTLAPAGSFTQNGGTFTVNAAGADINGSSDELEFVHQSLTGDGMITARVATLCNGTPGACPNGATKAGVMMRDGTGPDARYVMALVTPTATSKYQMQSRAQTGGTTTTGTASTDSAVPAWVRVQRQGDKFTAFFSTNGTTFTPISSSPVIPMSGTIRLGLALTSHASGSPATATFDNVTIVRNTIPSAPTVFATAGKASVNLSWNPLGGVRGYDVSRSTVDGGPYTLIAADVQNPGYLDTSVSNSTPFFYVVTAKSDAGTATSTQASATPSATAQNGQIALWALNGAIDSATAFPATSAASGASAGALTKSSTLSSGGAMDSMFTADPWPSVLTQVIDTGKFFEFSVTPTGSNKLTLQWMLFSLFGADGSGSWEIRSSADNFAAALAKGAYALGLPGTGCGGTCGIPIQANLEALGLVTGTTVFRFYAYNNDGRTPGVNDPTDLRRGLRGSLRGGTDLQVWGRVVSSLTIMPSAFHFGTVAVGVSSATTTFTVSNGTGTSAAVPVSLGGTDSSQFAIVSNDCPASLPAMATCSIGVQARPTSAGSKSASLNAGAASASILCTGVVPTLSVSPVSDNFGNVAVGSTVTHTFAVQNTGSVPATPAIAVTGTNPTDFPIGTNNCNVTLAPSATCTVQVRFQPASTGSKSATLQVGAGVTASMTGTGIAATVTVSPTSKDFGAQALGTAAIQPFFVINNTSSPFAITATITGPNAADFTFLTQGCGATLNPGNSCAMEVQFLTFTTGARMATLNIGTGLTAALSGFGAGGGSLAFAPGSKDFGSLLFNNTSATTVFTLSNATGVTQAVPVSLGGTDPSHFLIVSNSCPASLASGGMCSVGVQFKPTSVGPKSASLNAGSANAALIGTGVASAILVMPTDGNYGGVAVGSNNVINYSISNVSNSAVAMAIGLSGANMSEFSITGNNCGTSLAAAGNCLVVVRFSPTSTGNKSATLNLASGVLVNMTGTGFTPGSVTVTPSSKDFGTQPLGTSVQQSFVVTNGLTSAFAINASVTGTNAADFTIITNSCPASLAANGGTCAMTVNFVTSTSGLRTATLNIGTGVTVALSGTGAAAAPAITNLVVNDNLPAGCVSPNCNKDKWSIQSNFQNNVTPFGDRTYTVTSTGNAVLNGKPWLRVAADSKLFTGNPVATFKVTGSKVYFVVDDRHNGTGTKPSWLDATFTDSGFNAVINENGTTRQYSVWQKTVTSGSTVSMPPVSLNIPFYFVVVE